MKDQLIITNVIIIVVKYAQWSMFEHPIVLLSRKLDFGESVINRVCVLVFLHNQFLVTR